MPRHRSSGPVTSHDRRGRSRSLPSRPSPRRSRSLPSSTPPRTSTATPRARPITGTPPTRPRRPPTGTATPTTRPSRGDRHARPHRRHRRDRLRRHNASGDRRWPRPPRRRGRRPPRWRGRARGIPPLRSISRVSTASPPTSRREPSNSARDTLAELPQFADVSTVGALGYRSIGDSSTGFEHYINPGLIFDDVWLDPSEPESLVYRVDGSQRTLVSAMFIANARPLDDPELVDYGGPLMQWHNHDNLCWGLDDSGNPVVKGITDDAGNCARRHSEGRWREPDGARVDRAARVRSVRSTRRARCRPGGRRRSTRRPMRAWSR